MLRVYHGIFNAPICLAVSLAEYYYYYYIFCTFAG